MNHTEAKLIKGCLKGNRACQQELYDFHKGKMYALCLRYARCTADAEDILQEGFVKIYRDMHQYVPNAPIGAWMRRVMINTALEHLRRNKDRHVVDRDNIRLLHLETEEKAVSELNAQELRQRIGELPDDFRIVFNLYAIEGFTHTEIGEMLEISVANSKVRLNRARNMLKRSIAETNQYYAL